MAADQAKNNLSQNIGNCFGGETFDDVREKIQEGNIGVLPIENSYAGSIHTNFYNFLRYETKIIGEIAIDVNHALLGKISDITQIKKAYSHPQALSQCHDFLKKHGIEAIAYGDTASAAKMVAESNDISIAAVSSEYAADLYHLTKIQTHIQDQTGNTTRFLLVVSKELDISSKNITNKTSIIFETKDMPGALYKSLGCFATNNINLTKIESLPSYKNPFDYLFWIDIQGHTHDPKVAAALDELKFYTVDIRVLGEY